MIQYHSSPTSLPFSHLPHACICHIPPTYTQHSWINSRTSSGERQVRTCRCRKLEGGTSRALGCVAGLQLVSYVCNKLEGGTSRVLGRVVGLQLISYFDVSVAVPTVMPRCKVNKLEKGKGGWGVVATRALGYAVGFHAI